MAKTLSPELEPLARAYGVQTTYYNNGGRRRRARPEAIVAVLRSLGAPIETPADIAPALREHRQATWSRVVEPVAIVSAGQPGAVELRLPGDLAASALHFELVPEGGEPRSWRLQAADLPLVDVTSVEGVRYERRQLALPEPLPAGYHRLLVEAAGLAWRCLIISAPATAYGVEPQTRSWGAFLPLYALRTQRSAGVGDFSDLESLGRWTAGHGGSTVATLPLLAAFLEEPSELSPYAPVSRLFWNELYVDVEAAAAAGSRQAARDLLQSPAYAGRARALRTAALVPYREQFRLKREALESLAGCHDFGAPDPALRAYSEARPELEAYAAFRATAERQKQPWRLWPRRLRDGDLVAGDYDESAKRYHLYAQWLAERQLGAVGDSFRAAGLHFYLDYPLGVHRDGYDTWRYRDLFALDTSAGAPPDGFFTKGQDWRFQPLQPQALREDGYAYLISCLRNHLAQADILRIDHIMGLHRLYWLGKGFDPGDGAYVSYPAEELYALLCVESQRYRALIVGEDLGTVPRAVRQSMKRHAISGSYVVELEARAKAEAGVERALRPAPQQAVASLNTHDMPTFASYWRGLDIDDRVDIGHLGAEESDAAKTAREALKQALRGFLVTKGLLEPGAGEDERAVLSALLQYLAGSPATLLLVNLEDLWLEEEPQNVPGTAGQRPNWRHKARYALEELDDVPGLVDLLAVIERARRSSDGKQR